MSYRLDWRMPSVYKTVFYNEDDNIRLTRYWSSKDGKLILDIHSVGAEEYPGPEGNIQFDAGVWFAYNGFDRDGRIKVSYEADEPDDRYPDAYWSVNVTYFYGFTDETVLKSCFRILMDRDFRITKRTMEGLELRDLDGLHVFYGKRPKFLQRYRDGKKTGANRFCDDKRLQQFIEIDHADYAGPIDVSSRGCRRIECDDAFKSKLLKFDRLVFYIKKFFLDPTSKYYQTPLLRRT